MYRFRLLLAAVFSALAVFPMPSSAHGRLVEVFVVDRDSGQPLVVHYRDGHAFVEGRPGQRYAVRLVNRSGSRVLAVLSVDGINAVSGQSAAPDQAGYVLAPYQTTEVTGWRKSLSDVAGFEFSAARDSYAARTGRPHDVGVIGLAVFREQARAPLPPRIADNQASSGASANAPQPPAALRSKVQESQSIGTAHGAREYSRVERTRFQRAGTVPAETIILRYERRDTLIALGVIPPRPQYPGPRAFPAGFVPDP